MATLKVSGDRVTLKNVFDKDLTSAIPPGQTLPDPILLLTIVDGEMRYMKGIEAFGKIDNLCLQNPHDLMSLEGIPTKLEGYFRLDNAKAITSLNGIPKEVGGDLTIMNCDRLKELDVLPERVGKDLYIGSSNSMSAKPLKQVKYIGGEYVFLLFQVTGGLLTLFKIEMPKFKQLSIMNVDDKHVKVITDMLIEANKNPKERNRLMLEAQDYLMDHGLEKLATL